MSPLEQLQAKIDAHEESCIQCGVSGIDSADDVARFLCPVGRKLLHDLEVAEAKENGDLLDPEEI